ncbi:SDR family NAD(P)-dependent oxidoreductase [Sphingomonas bacterium]|uniref:SDR family NAD(P)-dependent oxidoreductase n=1 Tax=Sphingomonas bacterium TaxID=1895847 RepID=UPI0020C65E8E|nr:SDR family NAD(P)-dependent oxidoreductase [Sphingomonas bacterium]
MALVTGASSGLGARFAHTLAAAGAKVVLAARRAERLAAQCATIEAAGGSAIAVGMDVTDEASVIAAYDAAETAFGTVDTIVANAGMNVESAAVEVDVARFDELMAVNLRGPFLTAREGARRLIAAGSRERQHGRIVIVTSITAFKIDVGLAPYSASKAGVAQMGKVLARDWIRQGINVNMIAPGYIRTEINQEWFDTPQGAAQIAKFHRRRLLEADDLDAALLFLCSDGARAVTGTSITVDDGQSL